MTGSPDPSAAAALRERLGRWALGGSRDVAALAELTAGEEVAAAVVAVWQRRGWVAAATDRGLRLARRPRVFGRTRRVALPWEDLRTVTSGPARATMGFAGIEVDLLAAGPHDEFVRLLEVARAQVGGEAKPSVEDIRALAHRKLGRFVAYGYEAAIDGLPDRLEPGEQVERLATATGDFPGLLALTDRRLLLLHVAARRSGERRWSVLRSDVQAVEPVEGGIRLRTAAGDATLTAFVPPERRDEFLAVL